MNLTLIAIGTRGDVQPYVALAAGLQAAGHTVTLATHDIFQPLAEAHGLTFALMPGNPMDMLKSDEGQDWITGGQNPVTFVYNLKRVAEKYMREFVLDSLDVCRVADAIIATEPGYTVLLSVAEALGIPLIAGYPLPYPPTRTMASVIAPSLPEGFPLREQYNRLTFEVGIEALWQLLGKPNAHLREELLGLPRQQTPFRQMMDDPRPTVCGFSEYVFPRPADWGDHIHITGYWFMPAPEGWQPPPDLRDFLAAGPPPVYIGFGSMADSEGETLTTLAVDALAKAGQRGVLSAGWANIGTGHLPDTVFPLESAPHDWLFPQMAAVVHHGGAGTTSAGVRAGVPSILVPFMGDQFLWGRQVKALGVGPAPMPRKQITAERLAYAIRVAVSHAPMRQRAAALAGKVNAEDGVGNAVRVIEQMLA